MNYNAEAMKSQINRNHKCSKRWSQGLMEVGRFLGRKYYCIVEISNRCLIRKGNINSQASLKIITAKKFHVCNRVCLVTVKELRICSFSTKMMNRSSNSLWWRPKWKRVTTSDWRRVLTKWMHYCLIALTSLPSQFPTRR